MNAVAAGTLLRNHRERCGMSTQGASEKLGIEYADIHRAECGEDIGVYRFVELCSLYRLRKGDIIDLLAEYKKAGAA